MNGSAESERDKITPAERFAPLPLCFAAFQVCGLGVGEPREQFTNPPGNIFQLPQIVPLHPTSGLRPRHTDPVTALPPSPVPTFTHPFRAYTPAAYTFPLPEGHRFPAYKYAGIRDRLSGLLPVLDTPNLRWADAARVHDPVWLRRWRRGEVTAAEERAFGLPWSVGVVERARRAAGGSLAALHDALAVGWGANLAGGTHHAFAASAEGFCLVNDAAILTRIALDEGLARRVAILDLDVHQGNGTAALLGAEARAFTLSIHGERNYPFRKERSSLDLGLPDGVTDSEYLTVLRESALPALEAFRPDLLLYLAGADVLAGDRFGRFALTLEGVYERNQTVLAWAQAAGLPVVTLMAGGYNRDHALTIEAHSSVVLAGLHIFAH